MHRHDHTQHSPLSPHENFLGVAARLPGRPLDNHVNGGEGWEQPGEPYACTASLVAANAQVCRATSCGSAQAPLHEISSNRSQFTFKHSPSTIPFAPLPLVERLGRTMPRWDLPGIRLCLLFVCLYRALHACPSPGHLAPGAVTPRLPVPLMSSLSVGFPLLAYAMNQRLLLRPQCLYLGKSTQLNNYCRHASV
jgi:hypothetical protein